MVQGKVCESRNHIGTWKRWWERERERDGFLPRESLASFWCENNLGTRITLMGPDWSFGSVPFSCSVMYDSLWPHGLQHARPPCPSPTPRVYSNSCPLSQWCHPTISSSVVPFSSCLQSFLASGSFQMSQFFASDGQSIGVSASASVLPSNEYSGLISFRMDWLDLLAVQGTLQSLLQHHSSKASILWCSSFFIVQYLP